MNGGEHHHVPEQGHHQAPGGSGWPPAANLSGSPTSFPAGEEIRGNRSYRGPRHPGKSELEACGAISAALPSSSAVGKRSASEPSLSAPSSLPTPLVSSRPFPRKGSQGRGVTMQDLSPPPSPYSQPNAKGLTTEGGWGRAVGSNRTVLSALKGPPDQRFISGNFYLTFLQHLS